MRNFAVLILTHKRANNVVTVKTLRDNGYTGKIYICIDDEDPQEDIYRQIYGDDVIQFHKEDYIKKSMIMNPEKPHNIVLYARNAANDMALSKGLTHFLELDDDYTAFDFRYVKDGTLKRQKISDFDYVCELFCDWLDSTDALTISMMQGGDFIGGEGSAAWKRQLNRKVMNSFFCRTDRPLQFMGAINEDVNMYVSDGNKGKIFFSPAFTCIEQARTQQNSGGLTETYLEYGTFVKSFYTVMLCPSCVKISQMGVSDMRIHHRIMWNNAVPKIISEKWRK